MKLRDKWKRNTVCLLAAIVLACTAAALAVSPGLFRAGGRRAYAYAPLPTWEEYTSGGAYAEKNVRTLTEVYEKTCAGGAWTDPAGAGIVTQGLVITLSNWSELYRFSFLLYGLLETGSPAVTEQARQFFNSGARVYMLGDNIVMPAVTGEKNRFQSVAGDGNPFLGTFDGQGFTITGLVCYVDPQLAPPSSPAAMFVENAGTIKNLGLIDPVVDGAEMDRERAAGLAGVNTGNIENCFIENLNGKISCAGGSASGIAAENTGTIANAYYAGTLSGGTAYGITAGGTVSDAWFDAGLLPAALDAARGASGAALKAAEGMLTEVDGLGTRYFYPMAGSYPRLAGYRTDPAYPGQKLLSRPADVIYMGTHQSQNGAFAIDRCIDMSCVADTAYAAENTSFNFKGSLRSVARPDAAGLSSACGGVHPLSCGEEVGRNHAVINLRLTQPSGSDNAFVGMFQRRYGGIELTVENINFIGGSVKPAFASKLGGTYFASLLGGAAWDGTKDDKITLSNVHSSAEVAVENVRDVGRALHVGGLLGFVTGNVVMENCSVSGTVDGGDVNLYASNNDANAASVLNVGGFAGRLAATGGGMTNCTFSGTAYGVRTAYRYRTLGYPAAVGGIAGYLSGSAPYTLDRVENAGEVYTARHKAYADAAPDERALQPDDNSTVQAGGLFGVLNAPLAEAYTGYSVKNSGAVYVVEHTGTYEGNLFARKFYAGGIAGKTVRTQNFPGALAAGKLVVLDGGTPLQNTVVLGGVTPAEGDFTGLTGALAPATKITANTSSKSVTVYGIGAGGTVGNTEGNSVIEVNGAGRAGDVLVSGMYGGGAEAEGLPAAYCAYGGKITVTGAETASVSGVFAPLTTGAYISNCVNAGNISVSVTGRAEAGGITARAFRDMMSCFNAGDVTVTGSVNSVAGGLAGTDDAAFLYLEDGVNCGAITAPTAGGIVGAASRITVNSALNYGAVSGTLAGGIAGALDGVTVYGGKNAGNVSGANAAGIAGNLSASTVSYAINYGKKDGAAAGLYGNTAYTPDDANLCYDASALTADALYADTFRLRLPEVENAARAADRGGTEYATRLMYTEYATERGDAGGSGSGYRTYALASRNGRAYGKYLPTTEYRGGNAEISAKLEWARQLNASRDAELYGADFMTLTHADGSPVYENPISITDRKNAAGEDEGFIRFVVNRDTFSKDGQYLLSSLYASEGAELLYENESGAFLPYAPDTRVWFEANFIALSEAVQRVYRVDRRFKVRQPVTGAEKLWVVEFCFVPTGSSIRLMDGAGEPGLTDNTGKLTAGADGSYSVGYGSNRLTAVFETVNFTSDFTVEVWKDGAKRTPGQVFESAIYPDNPKIYAFDRYAGERFEVTNEEVSDGTEVYNVVHAKVKFELDLDRDFPSGGFEVRLYYKGDNRLAYTLSVNKATSGFAELRAKEMEAQIKYYGEGGSLNGFYYTNGAPEDVSAKNGTLLAGMNANGGYTLNNLRYGAYPDLSPLAGKDNALAFFPNLAVSPGAALAPGIELTVEAEDTAVEIVTREGGADVTRTLRLRTHVYTFVIRVTPENGDAAGAKAYRMVYRERAPSLDYRLPEIGTSANVSPSPSDPTRFEIAREVTDADGAFSVTFPASMWLDALGRQAARIAVQKDGTPVELTEAGNPGLRYPGASASFQTDFHKSSVGGLYEYSLELLPFTLPLSVPASVTLSGGGAPGGALEYGVVNAAGERTEEVVTFPVLAVEKTASRDSFATGLWFQNLPTVENFILVSGNSPFGEFRWDGVTGGDGYRGALEYYPEPGGSTPIDQDYNTPHRDFILNLQYNNDAVTFFTNTRLFLPEYASLYFRKDAAEEWQQVTADASQPLTDYLNAQFRVVAENPSYACTYTLKVATVPRNKQFRLEFTFENNERPDFFAAVLRTRVDVAGVATVTRQTCVWYGGADTVTLVNHIQADYLVDFLLPSGYAAAFTAVSAATGESKVKADGSIDCGSAYAEIVVVRVTVRKLPGQWGIESGTY